MGQNIVQLLHSQLIIVNTQIHSQLSFDSQEHTQRKEQLRVLETRALNAEELSRKQTKCLKNKNLNHIQETSRTNFKRFALYHWLDRIYLFILSFSIFYIRSQKHKTQETQDTRDKANWFTLL